MNMYMFMLLHMGSDKPDMSWATANNNKEHNMTVLITTKFGVEVWVLNIGDNDIRNALSHSATLTAHLLIDNDTTVHELIDTTAI